VGHTAVPADEPQADEPDGEAPTEGHETVGQQVAVGITKQAVVGDAVHRPDELSVNEVGDVRTARQRSQRGHVLGRCHRCRSPIGRYGRSTERMLPMPIHSRTTAMSRMTACGMARHESRATRVPTDTRTVSGSNSAARAVFLRASSSDYAVTALEVAGHPVGVGPQLVGVDDVASTQTATAVAVPAIRKLSREWGWKWV
jgi:hypothetical protein